MTIATIEIPADEGIEFLEKASAVVDEVIKLPIQDMPLGGSLSVGGLSVGGLGTGGPR